LSVAIVDPADVHCYQPGWTMVGAGVFEPESTRRAMADVIPARAAWVRKAAAELRPERHELVLEDGASLHYRMLVVCPGLKLDWGAVPGLLETLGRNGVTSNYRFDLAPVTRDLVSRLRHGRAIFTQPPMPIKCAGAPQKAMYLSCDHWRREGLLADIEVEFHSAAGVLFGVADYVPALMDYVARYGIDLRLGSRLVAVDGPASIATFERVGPDGGIERCERPFDLLHVVPPQVAHDVVRTSPLADETGFVAVDHGTLRHPKYDNVFALGDACAAPNAKTAAAVRQQAPVVAINVLAALDGRAPRALYDGYGSCPLTVERGRIVLAEFGYGGKLLPTFPPWLLDGKRASRRAWWLKALLLPRIYWQAMLKGREWLARPGRPTASADA
jgi:sulfide:quinone oxidoreductase